MTLPHGDPSLSDLQSVPLSGEGTPGASRKPQVCSLQPPAWRGGGAARGGDSAALRPPPRNFAAAGAPLLQEPKAFVPQCQGCPGRQREAGRLPLPPGTQAQPHCSKDFQASRMPLIRASSPPFARQSQVSSNSWGPLPSHPLTLTWSTKCPGKFLMARLLGGRWRLLYAPCAPLGFPN